MQKEDFDKLIKAKIIVFDLDGTLAKSKSHLSETMVSKLKKLLSIKMVSVISGGSFLQMKKQLIYDLEKETDVNFENLYLFPTSGASMYVFKKGVWENVYEQKISEYDKREIIKTIDESIHELNLIPSKIYGEMIEDRGSQVTFSALGQEAPVDEKMKWDPEKKKRSEILKILKDKLPNFEIRIGGLTSIDVTQKGLDKSYGINKMQEILKIPIDEMVYIGDSFGEEGNDISVRKSNIYTIDVSDTIGEKETEDIINHLVNRNWM